MLAKPTAPQLKKKEGSKQEKEVVKWTNRARTFPRRIEEFRANVEESGTKPKSMFNKERKRK
jgi:hypothetical protein